MSSAGTPIRPRLRSREAPRAAAQEPVVPSTIPAEPAGLPVLARIPQIATPAERTKLALRLDWLTALDWKRMRRMRVDSNWVAGGVLCLVLFLLLLISLNRGLKTSESPAAENDAPTWKSASAAGPLQTADATAAKAPAAVSATESGVAAPAPPAVEASTVLTPNLSGAQFHGVPSTSSPKPAAIDFEQHAAAPNAIYYPKTRYPAPSITLAQSGRPAASYPARSQPPNEAIRTAQRDAIVPYGAGQYAPAPAQPSSVPRPAAGRAQLDGIITQP